MHISSALSRESTHFPELQNLWCHNLVKVDSMTDLTMTPRHLIFSILSSTTCGLCSHARQLRHKRSHATGDPWKPRRARSYHQQFCKYPACTFSFDAPMSCLALLGTWKDRGRLNYGQILPLFLLSRIQIVFLDTLVIKANQLLLKIKRFNVAKCLQIKIYANLQMLNAVYFTFLKLN